MLGIEQNVNKAGLQSGSEVYWWVVWFAPPGPLRGARKSHQRGRTQEEPGGTKRNKEEPRGARRTQGGARRSPGSSWKSQGLQMPLLALLDTLLHDQAPNHSTRVV